MSFHAGLVRKAPQHLRSGMVAKSPARKAVSRLSHPSGHITGIDEATGLPIVRRDAAHSPPLPESKLGKEEPGTGREILHASNNPDTIQTKVKDEHQWVKDDIEDLVRGVPGAKLHGSRDEKPADRLEEKIEDEGQNPRTIPDYSGFRVAVDHRDAHKGAVKAIRGHFKVVREKDEFEKGAPDTAFHAHMLQIQRAGSDVTHEVQVLPKQVADSAEATHALYEKARTGDKAAATKMKAHNEAAWQEFEAAQGHKYKFGSTQANLPAHSEAQKAIAKMARSIPAHHLAGDGKDIDAAHVTVRYGIQSEDKKDSLRKFIRGQKPFTAKLGPTAAFPPSEHSDGAAPIHAPVHSPELHRMNTEIGKHGDFAPSSFPTYKPHVTVAYVKPEIAKKYVGNHTTDGKEFRVSSIAISDRDGNKEDVPMLGESNSETEGGRGESPEPEAGVGTETTPAPVTQEPTVPKAAAPKSDAQTSVKIAKGSQVTLPDGRAGTVRWTMGKDARVDAAGSRWDGKIADLKSAEPIEGVTSATPGHETPIQGAVAEDFDKTLAEFKDGSYKAGKLGAPRLAEVAYVKQLLADGRDVWIYTARAITPEDVTAIKAWTKMHLGRELPVTNLKYKEFGVFRDDRGELPK